MDTAFYFPWARKGLGAYIDEKESVNGTTKGRAELTIKSNYTVRHKQPEGAVGSDKSQRILEKTVKFIGPGDVLKINPSAVMKVHPEENSEGFPKQYLPYIEFWEPDFLWRYTPASHDQDRLRPWLALVVCRQEDVQLKTLSGGLSYFTFTGDEEAWNASFLDVDELYRTAHAQGRSQETPEFCRLLGLRNEDELLGNTDYVALLVPAYETGRLRGLGREEEDIMDIEAQKPAWERSFSAQKARRQGLEFPVYYKWFFRTGENDFDTYVKGLGVSKVNKPGLLLDVTDMGEGYSYDTVAHESSRTVITMPAATLTMSYRKEEAFPAKKSAKYATESTLYDNLKWMMDQNPVFQENKANSQGKDFGEEPGDEDPWIVPPAYGARHAMSFRIDDPDKPWLEELNLDIHHRAAAGLGRSIVQKHQEELMDRAWKQVEAVQALNMELYRRLLSIQTNKSLQRKTVDQYASDGDGSKYIEYMMRYLSSMKDAGADKISLSSIIRKAGIPAAFATPSFQNNAEKLSRIVSGMDTATLMDHIVKDQLFRSTAPEPAGAVNLERLHVWGENGKEALLHGFYTDYLSSFFSPRFSAEMREGGKGLDDLRLKMDFQQKQAVVDFGENWFTDDKCKFGNSATNLIFNVVFDTGELDTAASILKAFKRFDPDGHTIYPRLYVLDDEDYNATCKGTESVFYERPEGLSFKKNGVDKVVPFEAVALPDDEFKTIFGEQYDMVRTGNGTYGFFRTDIFNRRPSSRRWVVFSGFGGYRGQHDLVFNQNCIYCGYLQDDYYMSRSMDAIRFCLKETLKEDEEKLVNVVRSFLNKLFSFAGSLSPEEKKNWEQILSNEMYYKCPEQILPLLSAYLEPVNMTVLNKLSENDLYDFLCTFLFKIPTYHDYFGRIWMELMGGHTMLSAFCYLDELGYWMLAMLPHIADNNKTAKKILPSLEKIDRFMMNHPDYIVIPKSEYSAWRKKEFSGTQFADFLRTSRVKVKYPEACEYYDDFLKLVESKRSLVGKEVVETPPPTPVDNQSVTRLQESMENKEALDRIREVAATYYEAFYADTEEGERLRQKYLDELLMSKYPILAYPFFPEPTYHYLKMVSDQFIIPGLNEITDESVSMFLNNPAFTEAFLCGMNTEMGTELQWREYPTDRRGSYFRKFWDSESSAEAIQSDSFFDVKPLHLWGKTSLGGNHLAGKSDLLIFAIKSDLFRLYPSTRVYLNRAVKGKTKSTVDFDTDRMEPVMETFVRENILLVGFKTNVRKVLGDPANGDYGYMLAFEQDVDDLNFVNGKDDRSKYDDSAKTADALKDRVTIYGKHVSLFV